MVSSPPHPHHSLTITSYLLLGGQLGWVIMHTIIHSPAGVQCPLELQTKVHIHVIMEKAPTMTFFLLKVATTAFTFRNLDI